MKTMSWPDFRKIRPHFLGCLDFYMGGVSGKIYGNTERYKKTKAKEERKREERK